MEPRDLKYPRRAFVLDITGAALDHRKAWWFSPAGVGEHSVDTWRLPRNLGRPALSAAQVRMGTGSRTPGLPITRAGSVGAKHRRTPRYGNANHKEACRTDAGNRNAS